MLPEIVAEYLDKEINGKQIGNFVINVKSWTYETSNPEAKLTRFLMYDYLADCENNWRNTQFMCVLPKEDRIHCWSDSTLLKAIPNLGWLSERFMTGNGSPKIDFMYADPDCMLDFYRMLEIVPSVYQRAARLLWEKKRRR